MRGIYSKFNVGCGIIKEYIPLQYSTMIVESYWFFNPLLWFVELYWFLNPSLWLWNHVDLHYDCGTILFSTINMVLHYVLEPYCECGSILFSTIIVEPYWNSSPPLWLQNYIVFHYDCGTILFSTMIVNHIGSSVLHLWFIEPYWPELWLCNHIGLHLLTLLRNLLYAPLFEEGIRRTAEE